MIRHGSSSSGTKYLFQRVKPRLILFAALVLYHQTFEGNALVHPHVAPNGNIHLQSTANGNLIDKIEFENGMGDVPSAEEEPGPFFGDLDPVAPPQSERIALRKRDCDLPSVATRGLLGSTVKRAYFALNHEEMKRKMREEDALEHRLKKRDIAGIDGILPWTCETKYEWKDMGADHYPRFVRTAQCKTKTCVRGFFRCNPRKYKTKILRRITGPESSSCEEDDVSLPETLRSNWRFITVTINLCCDCTGPGRLPGGEI